MFEKKPSYKKYKLQIIEFNLAMYNFFVKGGRHLETKKKSQYYDNFTPDKLDTMESEHNYIQYIFPVMRFSDYQEEKVMVRTVARILVKRPVVLQTIRDFTVTFADFLIAKGKKEGNWFMHGNHNKNRISRVFMCCKLFGLEKQLTDFQYALTNILGYDYMNDDSSKRKYQKVLQTRRIN
ncbi:hypothetical protein ECANGB1_2412 [Enterospora canceri]|uniref:Opioid growth factor receptor (OGFr) conserved domain-containing protein n=1 Tax=Enterospora canceri TaxID=1081671 RepID=A0A1Y1S5E3_9MICR|nr:hypothetical protein ECANGB1_2412 [Enterospora canceri]